MTAETSNARGELRMTDIREDARETLQLLRDRLADDEVSWRALCRLMPMLAAPPPAAARGDVRGLVAKLAAHVRPTCSELWDEAQAFLAAEGVQAGEPPADAEVRAPSYEALLLIAQSVCGALERAGVTDCDDPGEAIDVLREQYEAKIAALSQQPEARGVVDDETIERVLNTRMRYGQQLWWVIDRGDGIAIGPSHRSIARCVIEAYIAALTGERNVR